MSCAGPSAVCRGLAGAATLVCLLIAACASPPGGVPVVERRVVDEPTAGTASAGRSSVPPRMPGDWRPEFYTIQRGDTLYGIALDHGLDYREVASWNRLANPNVIYAGQRLRLRPPPGWQSPEPQPEVVEPSVPAEVVAATPVAPAAPARSEATTPAAAADRDVVARPLEAGPPVQAQALPEPPPIKSAPKGTKVAYSDAALAQLRGETIAPIAAAAPRPAASTTPVAKAQTAEPSKPAPAAPAAAQQPASEAQPAPPPKEPQAPVSLANAPWIWPTQGKLLHGFNAGANPKGVAIAGELGQAVVASAAGKVVYSGSGLRGYGNLVIIKHSETYLSVYAHNRKLLVKEGERVTKGQKIAEMGNSDAKTVALHFEIRRYGKPVDPLEYLPEGGAS